MSIYYDRAGVQVTSHALICPGPARPIDSDARCQPDGKSTSMPPRGACREVRPGTGAGKGHEKRAARVRPGNGVVGREPVREVNGLPAV